jgi:4-aminobutyrate aminotransferase-like enzyme/Ser/Thr protein kinase RdoA (MazF antagonist)
MDGELRGISSPEGGYDRSSPLADVPGTGDDPGGKASRLAAWERLASPPPAFPEHAARQILWERFGKTGSVAPLGGERDQNFRVETPGGQRFLLKISHPADRLPTLQMQAAALRHIEAVDPGLPVMRVVPTVAGEPWAEVAGPDGRAHPVRLFTFLPGRLIEPTGLASRGLRAFGETAARLGRALRGFFHPAADYEILWDLSQAARLRPLLSQVAGPGLRARAERALDRFEARAAPALPALRAQVIHADLSLSNVLFGEDQRVSGIVDFGDMTHAPLVCDLAVAVADVLSCREDAVAAAEVMISGYVSVTQLEDGEADLLADLVAARLAMALIISAWRAGLGLQAAAGDGPGPGVAGGARPEPGVAGGAGPEPGVAPDAGPGARDGSTRSAFLDQIDAMGADAVTRRFREACLGLPYRPAATSQLLARRRRVLPRSPLFYTEPVHLVRGQGVWLYDPAGRAYLDCYNNVPAVGHGHPRVVRAVAEQQRLLATHSRYLHEAAVELAERLTATLPPGLDAVLLVNSGSEAGDLAWRVARAATGRSGAVVTGHAYHGLTEATHALSPEEWAPGERPAHVATVPAPDGYRGRYRREEAGWCERYAAELGPAARALGDHGLAAVYIDPAFTADGVLDPPPGYLAAAADRVRALGGLLVADEVQAGHGRCGTHLWSFSAAGIVPDLVVMGKPMGNGFPVAALVAGARLLSSVPAETELFSTFGGNPVACAAALAVLDVIDTEDLLASAAETGAYLRRGLERLAARHPVIGDVRGRGLLLGVDLVAGRQTREPAPGQARAVTEALRERRILIGRTGPSGNVLKIRPPLVFRPGHADLLLRALDEVLGTAGDGRPAR